jgi:hypothetical protein
MIEVDVTQGIFSKKLRGEPQKQLKDLEIMVLTGLVVIGKSLRVTWQKYVSTINFLKSSTVMI